MFRRKKEKPELVYTNEEVICEDLGIIPRCTRKVGIFTDGTQQYHHVTLWYVLRGFGKARAFTCHKAVIEGPYLVLTHNEVRQHVLYDEIVAAHWEEDHWISTRRGTPYT